MIMAYLVTLAMHTCVTCGRQAYAEVFNAQNMSQGYFCTVHANAEIKRLSTIEHQKRPVRIDSLEVPALPHDPPATPPRSPLPNRRTELGPRQRSQVTASGHREG
jgi:hypothetical protein